MIVNPGFGGGLNLTGTTDQVVGFDANGKPAAVSKEELRGPQGIQGPVGATGAQGPQGPAGPGMPSGVIVMWSGAANAIPAGWLLCNGSNGTPDLRNRFIVGAGSFYGVGATGGSEAVTLTVEQMPYHAHSQQLESLGNYYYYTGSNHIMIRSPNNGDADALTGGAGGSQPHENRPPYYALCFIMKQ